MREILFRGERKDIGEWIEGAFLNDRDGTFYICPAATDITYGDNGNRRRIGCWYAVIPETVGQFTGMFDKNGKRIFEGDILDFQINIKMKIRGKVIFARGGFQFESPGFEEEYGGSVCFDSDVIAFSSSCLEVIGNIYDNPDLLPD